MAERARRTEPTPSVRPASSRSKLNPTLLTLSTPPIEEVGPIDMPQRRLLGGARGCRIRPNRHGYLTLHLHCVRFPGETGGLRAPACATRPEAARTCSESFATPIAAEMRAGTLRPSGTCSTSHRHPRRGVPRSGRHVRQVTRPPSPSTYAGWIERQRPPLVRPAQQRDYRQHFDGYLLRHLGTRARLRRSDARRDPAANLVPAARLLARPEPQAEDRQEHPRVAARAGATTLWSEPTTSRARRSPP